MDIEFLITTYGRKESCQRLVNSIKDLGNVVVALDGTDYDICGALNINPKQHLGKNGYWRLVNMLFRHRGTHKYYMMIPDDFIISETQVMEAIEIWESIDDPRKICLNLFADRIGVSCWTLVKPKDKGNVWQTGWVDMCFLCEERFFAELEVIPMLHSPNKSMGRSSSGVGAYISRKLNKGKFHFYQVKESLAVPTIEHTKSQMHR